MAYLEILKKQWKNAIEKGIELPQTYEGFSFHGYETIPLSTDSLTAAEVLKFRDDAFIEYHSHPAFLEKVGNKFGSVATNNINDMLKVRLKRRIFED